MADNEADWSDANPGVVLHFGHACAGCGEEPIVDRRYHCAACRVDLCEICVARGRVDRDHVLSVFFSSVLPRPPGPIQFAVASILSHRGRRTANEDKRTFTVRFKGSYWQDEELQATQLNPQLVAEYDAKSSRARRRRTLLTQDPLERLVVSRRKRIARRRQRVSATEVGVHPPQLLIDGGEDTA